MVLRELVALVPSIEMKSNFTAVCEINEVARRGSFRYDGY